MLTIFGKLDNEHVLVPNTYMIARGMDVLRHVQGGRIVFPPLLQHVSARE